MRNYFRSARQVQNTFTIEQLEARQLLSSTLIPLTNGRDIVFDDLRDQLYITTSTGQLQRYDVESGNLLPALAVGSSLNGVDITPDFSAVYIADGIGSVRKVNLSTLGVTTFNYTKDSLETGAWDVAIFNNGKALFTSQHGGSGWVPIREINLANDALTIRADYPGGEPRQDSLIARGADRSLALIQEANTTGGPIATYNATTDSFPQEARTDTFIARAPGAVNRNSNLMAMPLNGATILNPSLGVVRTLTGIDGGMVFDPNQDVFYGVNSATDEVIAFDTYSWTEKYRLPIGQNVTGATAMGTGAMSVDAGGKRLFLLTTTGVRMIDIPQPTGVAASARMTGFPTYIKGGVAGTFTVTLHDPAGNLATGYRGTVRFASSDPNATLPSEYTFTAADGGTKIFTATLHNAGSHSITVIDESDASITLTKGGIIVHTAPTTVIPVTDRRDVVYDEHRGMVYLTTTRGVIERYHIATETLLSPFVIGGQLVGADISPDGSSLYVANAVRGATQGFFHKVDLNSGAVTNLPYDLTFGEGGAWDVAIANNGKGFFSTMYEGSGWTPLRELDLATDVLKIRNPPSGQVRQNTHITRAANRSLLFFTESNSSAGPAFTYDSVTNLFPSQNDFGSSQTNTISAVNRDGSLIAMEKSGTTILNPALDQVMLLPGIDGGIIFDPVLDVLYAVNSTTDRLIAYRTDTWQEIASYPIGENVGASTPMAAGVTAISDDGRFVFLSTAQGVRILQVKSKAHAGSSITAAEGSTVSLSGGGSTGPINTYEWDFDYDGTTFDVDATGVMTSLVAPDGPAQRTIALRVIGSNFSDIDTITLTSQNVAPTANVSFPALVENSWPLYIRVKGIVDPGSQDTAAGWSISYDFDDDGVFEVAGSTETQVIIPQSYFPDGPSTLTSRVRITDKDGGFTDYVKTTAVQNEAPHGELNNGGDVTLGEDGSVSFINLFDKSPADVAAGFTFNYDFNDDGVYEVIGSGSSRAVVPAEFLMPGLCTIRGQIVDKDGGARTYTTTIQVLNPIGAYQQDPGSTGLVSIEAEINDGVFNRGGKSWAEINNPFSSSINYSGGKAMQVGPNTGSLAGGTSGSQIDFRINFTKTGLHYLWIRGFAQSNADDSVHAGLDGVMFGSNIIGFGRSGSWSRRLSGGALVTFNVTSTGLHALNIWMREDGFVLDKIVVTTSSNYTPTGDGPAISQRIGGGSQPPANAAPTLASLEAAPSSVQKGQNLTLTASDAADVDNNLEQVVFYHDTNNNGDFDAGVDAEIGSDSDSANGWSLTFSTSTYTISNHRFFARAKDTAGAFSTVAIAFADVIAPSAEPVFQQSADGLVSMEAEHYHSTTSRGGKSWTAVTGTNYSGGGALQVGPNTGGQVNTDIANTAAQVDYKINFTQTGTYYLWIRGSSASNADDSIHAGVDGVVTAQNIIGFGGTGKWSKKLSAGGVIAINITTLGIHTINLWMREEGLIVDKLVLTRSSSYVPSGNGPAESLLA